MESIEKLRDYANEPIINGTLMNAMIDEIEREIAERYMELPLDAEGVPIHVGDRLVRGAFDEIICTVTKLKFNGRDWWYESSNDCFACCGSRHAPRTLEDVLRDALANAACAGNDIGRNLVSFEPYVTQLADEIRELLGGDAE